MGLLVSQVIFNVCELLSKLGAFLKTAIMATIAECHFHAFSELSGSPNFFDVPSNLPFYRSI
jgi:hypothetical protein